MVKSTPSKSDITNGWLLIGADITLLGLYAVLFIGSVYLISKLLDRFDVTPIWYQLVILTILVGLVLLIFFSSTYVFYVWYPKRGPPS
jgi:cell shape-determining protein MreD